MGQNKKKLKLKNVAANADNELRFAAKKGQTIKVREGSKLLSAGGKALQTFGAAGKAVSGLALIAGGVHTATSLVNSLRRGEGFARLLKIGKNNGKKD